MGEHPAEFEFDRPLKDGQAIRLRPVRPDGLNRVRRFLRQVGRESAHERFFGMKLDSSSGEFRGRASVDLDGRLAHIAVHDDQLVAQGRNDMLPERSADDSRVAEVTVVLDGARQERGIGRRLLQHLFTHASRRDITEFEAHQPATPTIWWTGSAVRATG